MDLISSKWIVFICLVIECAVELALPVNAYSTQQNLTASRGENVSLSCYTKISESVDWRYGKTATDPPSNVYENYRVTDSFKDKVKPPEDTTAGYYNLTLLNVQPDDSGWYVCIEDGGNGAEHAIILDVSAVTVIVIDPTPGPGSTTTAATTGTSSVAIVVPIIIFAILVVIAVVGILVWYQRKRKQRSRDGRELVPLRDVEQPNNDQLQPIHPAVEPNDVEQPNNHQLQAIPPAVEPKAPTGVGIPVDFWLYFKRYKLGDLNNLCDNVVTHTYNFVDKSLQLQTADNVSHEDSLQRMQQIKKFIEDEKAVLSTERVPLQPDFVTVDIKEKIKALCDENRCALRIEEQVLVYYVTGPKNAVDDVKRKIERLLQADVDKLSFTTKFGTNVNIFQGDLVKQVVGTIVCPVNNEINLNGGTAGAVVKEAGETLRNECKEYIACMGTLRDTQTIHTAAGNMKTNVQFIIFTAGPQPNKTTSRQMYAGLVKTYLNCLLHANDFLRVTSISIPAINAGGVRGVDKHLIARAAYEALACFDNLQHPKRTLKDVNFVDRDIDATRAFVVEFKLANTDKAVRDTVLDVIAPLAALSQRVNVSLSRSSDRKKFSTPSGIELGVSCGSIVQNKFADVIVCSVNSGLDLAGGAAKAIKEAAGDTVEKECRAFIDTRRRLEEGQVMHTSAGKLRSSLSVHYVLFVGLPSPNQRNSDPVQLELELMEAFFNCLYYANSALHVSSIALPAIGSGAFRAKLDVVVSAALHAVARFDQLPSEGRFLQKIWFVDTNNNVAEAFRKHFTAAAAAPAPPPPAASSPPAALSTGSPTSYSFQTDTGLKVEVYEGDLVKERSDVIVCSVNNRIDIAAGAAKFVANAAGDALKQRRKELIDRDVRLKAGEVICLPAGNLQAKHVLFVFPCYEQSPNGIDVGMRMTFANCLNYANDCLHASSVAIPALGAGVAGASKERVVQAAYDAVIEFDVNAPQPRHLKNVKFVSIESSTAAAFVQTFTRCRGGVQPAGVDSPRDPPAASAKQPSETLPGVCVHCLDANPEVPLKCKKSHGLCDNCHEQLSLVNTPDSCPACAGLRYSNNVSRQQPSGTMYVEPAIKKGDGKTSMILISYDIPGGVQNSVSPSPGSAYGALNCSDVLPLTTDGKKIALLWRRAFVDGRTFTFGVDGNVTKSTLLPWSNTDDLAYAQKFQDTLEKMAWD